MPPPPPGNYQGGRPPSRPPHRRHRGWLITLGVIAGIFVIGGIASLSSKPTPAANSSSAVATASSHTTSAPAGPCSRWHWPRHIPRRAIGQTLFHANSTDLSCFNLAAAYTLGDGHNVMNDPANTTYKWIISRISPAPGATVKASTPITLYVRRRHPRPAAPSPVPPQASSPAPAGCYPLSDEGTCYEPGEYCRDSDEGMTGVAGDGESIICEDNDGLRWEPVG